MTILKTWIIQVMRKCPKILTLPLKKTIIKASILKKTLHGQERQKSEKGMSSQNIIDTPENVAVDDIVIEESYAFANRDVEKWKSETNKNR